MKELLELVRAIAWPAVTAAALAAFYGPLVEFLRDLGKRATKISAFHIEIEFPALTEAPLSLFATKIQELSTSDAFESDAEELKNLLRDLGPMDYAVIDLGEGKRWLTSRLFLFAILLERIRAMQCLVFVATIGGEPKRFVGIASPGEVHWVLAQRFPWLERSFAKAYASAVGGLENEPAILSTSGGLDPGVASHLISEFLEPIQRQSELPGWVALTTKVSWEHADWINVENSDSILGKSLQRSWVDGTANLSRAEITSAILRSEGKFVALLEPTGRFLRLVSRETILEQLAEEH